MCRCFFYYLKLHIGKVKNSIPGGKKKEMIIFMLMAMHKDPVRCCIEKGKQSTDSDSNQDNVLCQIAVSKDLEVIYIFYFPKEQPQIDCR